MSFLDSITSIVKTVEDYAQDLKPIISTYESISSAIRPANPPTIPSVMTVQSGAVVPSGYLATPTSVPTLPSSSGVSSLATQAQTIASGLSPVMIAVFFGGFILLMLIMVVVVRK